MTREAVTEADASGWLVQAEDVTKAFGQTQALRRASFDVAAGEVHVLAGENGSGKSTLVKVLSGVQVPDSGVIRWRMAATADVVEAAPASPAAAQDLGLATVFQEVKVAESSSVLDNVWLGSEGIFRARRSRAEKERRARQLFEELLGASPPLGTPAGELSLSQRQALSIVRAILREPQILLLDEATSSLDFDTRARLIRLLKRLTDNGAGVVFISHRVDEMNEIGDRVTVMRSGETVGTFKRGAWSTEDLVAMMSGAEAVSRGADRRPAARDHHHAPVLAVRDLVLAPGRSPMSLEIRPGEVVGVAGLEGHGQADFLDALRGTRPAAGGVYRLTPERELLIRSPSHAASLGIAFVPRERRGSIFPWMSIRENFGMPTLDRDARALLLRPARTRARLARYVKDLGIVMGDADDRITTLSGGNQQKVIIARWLAAEPRILVLNDPTRGIDLRTKQEFYALLDTLAESGLAIVMASSDLDEHLQLMDRVLVFREHELFQTLGREGLTRRGLVAAFFDHPVASPT